MSTAKEATRLVTAEELWALPEQPGVRYELAEGELVEVPGAGGVHAQIVMTLVVLLHAFVSERKLGRVFADGLGYILRRNPDVLRIPDVSFVARERIPAGGIPEGFWPGAPDLAVEIVSPNDLAQEINDKVHQYLEVGTRMVWVLWPNRRTVTVYLPEGQLRDLGPNDELDGGEVLPGFSVRVASLFEVAQ